MAYDLFETYFDLPNQRVDFNSSGFKKESKLPTKYVVLRDVIYVWVATKASLVDTTIYAEINVSKRMRPALPFTYTSRREASGFRPKLPSTYAGRDLYLTEDDQDAFNCFLATGYGSGPSTMGSLVPEQNTQLRAEALKPFITVLPGHWGGYWHVETQPYGAGVIFASGLRNALVMVNAGYDSGHAYYERVEDRWVFRWEAMTGTE